MYKYLRNQVYRQLASSIQKVNIVNHHQLSFSISKEASQWHTKMVIETIWNCSLSLDLERSFLRSNLKAQHAVKTEMFSTSVTQDKTSTITLNQVPTQTKRERIYTSNLSLTTRVATQLHHRKTKKSCQPLWSSKCSPLRSSVNDKRRAQRS